MGAASGGTRAHALHGSLVIMGARCLGHWYIDDHLLVCMQVAIGKMFEMFIVHDHADLQLLKVLFNRAD